MLYQISWSMYPDKKVECNKLFAVMTPDDDAKDAGDKIKIVGHVSVNHLISLYDNCHAVIYASYSGPENLPPIEALARRKKIINSNYPGAKEQLKNFPIYFNPKSPKDIANSMQKSLNKKLKIKKRKINELLKSKSSKIYIENLIKELTAI